MGVRPEPRVAWKINRVAPTDTALATTTTTAIVPHEPWVPQNVRDRARDALLAALDQLNAQIVTTPTAAYYQVRLAHIQALLTEADKVGGDPQDRMKSYAEVVKAKLDGKSKREITRTVTMKETITEGNDEPARQEITILSPADCL
jgi:hypothetical protein